jgi:hypothetical protein
MMINFSLLDWTATEELGAAPAWGGARVGSRAEIAELEPLRQDRCVFVWA